MRVSVVTPTHGRPEAMRLAGKWLDRQRRQPDEWIVVDESAAPPGLANFRENLVTGLRRCTGDIVVAWEDDDYYRPNHIDDAVAGLTGCLLFGVRRQLAFDLQRRRHLDRCIGFAPLCAMSFRREFVPAVIDAALSMNPCLELALWQRARETGQVHGPADDPTVVGMKGMPGAPNVSDPAAVGKVWVDDPDAAKLREWLGDDALDYEAFLAERAEAPA